MIYPVIDVINLSFFSWEGLGPKTFVGLANFGKLFHDPRFYNSMYNTLLFTVMTVVGQVGIGLLLALALHRRVAGWRVFRVIFYLNCIVSTTAIGILWSSLLNPNISPINYLWNIVHLTAPRSWLGNPNLVMWILIGVTIWQWSGFPMLFLYVAMENIPQELYEVAALDGVTPFKSAWYITFPLIKPVLLTITMFQIIFSFRAFDIVFVMTKGGPGYSSQVLTLYMYYAAFWFREYGYGASLAVIMLILVFIMVFFYIWVTRLEEA